MTSSKTLLAPQRLAAYALACALAFASLAACNSNTPASGGDSGSAEFNAEQQALIDEAKAAEEEEERREAERDAQEGDDDGMATSNSGDGDVVEKVTNLDGTVSVINTEDLLSDRDLSGNYDDDHTVNVTLSGSSAKADGTGATMIDGALNISEGGTYVLSGELMGEVVVDVSKDSNEKVQLVLDGAAITSDHSAAIYVREADKVFVTLAAGSDNALTSSGTFEADGDVNVDGAIFSRDDLTINGTGSLSISSTDNGIVAKDELKLVSGVVSVSADGHGIQANDAVIIHDGSWTVSGGADGIHCSNSDDLSWGYIYMDGGSVGVAAASDGLDATSAIQIDGGSLAVDAGDDGIHADHDTVINGGTVDITKSYEGIEGGTITIAGGKVNIVSSDDGFNASGVPTEAADSSDNGGGFDFFGFGGGGGGFGGSTQKTGADLLISGGVITVEAEGDGIDSNGNCTMTGGELYVSGPESSMNGALDFGDGYEGVIEGGICIAAGNTSMPENWGSNSTQGSALVSVSGNAGDKITVTDEDGNELASFTPTKRYECVVASTPEMEVGGTYTVSSASGSSCTFTLSSITYSNTGFGGFGGGDQGPGGGGGNNPFGGGGGPFGG